MPATLGTAAAARLAATLVCVLAVGVALLSAVAPGADAKHRHPTKWDCLAHYESTHRWAVNTGNGHFGGLQFSLSTWRYFGGPNHSGNKFPHKATRKEQIHVAKRVAWHGWKGRRAQGGRSAWPNTWPRCF